MSLYWYKWLNKWERKDKSLTQNSKYFMEVLQHLEKVMATHSSILAWEIPWTEEPGELQSMGSHRVGYDWVTITHAVSGRWNTFQVWAAHSNFFPKRTDCQRVGKRLTLQRRSLAPSAGWLRSTSAQVSDIWDYVKWHFPSMVFLPQTHNPSIIIRKHQASSSRGTRWSVLLQTVKGFKNKEILRHCHSQHKPKET